MSAMQPMLGYSSPSSPPTVLNLVVDQDYIGVDSPIGVFIEDLMTGPEATNYFNGVYATINIAGTGAPGRGYWVITGDGGAGQTAPPGASGVSGGDGFVIDGPPANVVINFDTSLIRIYGGGASGGSADPTLFGSGGVGGSAISMIDGGGSVDLNITNTNGSNTGRIFGGGGGGGAGAGNLGNPAFPCAGGGAAAGWNPGGASQGGSQNGVAGGVYDANNGGTNDPAVAGGAGGTTGGSGGGAGGGLALAGTGASGAGGAAGLAVNRNGTAGTTTIISGGAANFVKGVVQ